MKIIHTSDWHLGQSFYHFSREEEYIDFFRQLRHIISEEKPDALLVAGDIFDQAAPPVSAVSLYNRELVRIQRENPALQVIVTAGNHDSPSRLSASDVLWNEFGVTVIGAPERIDGQIQTEKLILPIKKDGVVSGWVAAVPYMHPSSLPSVEDDSYDNRLRAFYGELCDKIATIKTEEQPVIAMGHLTLAGCDMVGREVTIGNIDGVPADIWGNRFNYTALGHIHRPQHVVYEHVRYSGSVLPVSFDENYPHSVTVVQFEGAQVKEVVKREITPLVELCNVPQKPQLFDEVKRALLDFPADKKAFIRANILLEGITSPTMYEEAQECLNDKQARLCLLNPVRKAIERSDDVRPGDNVVSLEELRNIQPMDMALQAYREQHEGEEMPVEAQVCLQAMIEQSKSVES